MSIIYDALKKVEKASNIALEVQVAKERKPGFQLRNYLLSALAILLVLYIANLYRLNFKPAQKTQSLALSEQTPAPPILPQEPLAAEEIPPPPEPLVKPTPTLVLNGLFYAQDESYVLINNQIVREGDAVDGAIVTQILPDAVELEFEGKPIRLSNAK